MTILKKLGSAAAWLGNLAAAKLHAEQGIILHADGTLHHGAPNPAAMWPPHRPHPTPKHRSSCSPRRLAKRAKKKAEGLVMGVVDGRVGYVERARLLQVQP